MTDTEVRQVEETAEIKSVTSKILGFGIISLLAMILAICTVLLVMLSSASSQLYKAKETILEQTQTVNTLQRRLDNATGRLSVYEDFLIGTHSRSIRHLVRRYLLDTKVRSDETTLRDFEEWVYTKGNTTTSVPTAHIGGPE